MESLRGEEEEDEQPTASSLSSCYNLSILTIAGLVMGLCIGLVAVTMVNNTPPPPTTAIASTPLTPTSIISPPSLQRLRLRATSTTSRAAAPVSIGEWDHRSHRGLGTALEPPAAPTGEQASLPPTEGQTPLVPQQQPARAMAPPNYTAEALADEVIGLPGLNDPISFRQFAGYLPISDAKNIFYWYFEAEDQADQAPLTLWTNGGPGCSGLIGLMTENGPFRVNRDGKTLKLNPSSWTKLSHIVFVEIPGGVGFSYSTNFSDYSTNDDRTAADNYLVVQSFLAKFPHLRDHDFYLTSESYGGHYLPQLAKKIVEENEAGVHPAINLKGFAVGNPFTDPVENEVGMFETLKDHDLVNQELYVNWTVNCKDVGTLTAFASETCNRLENAMLDSISEDPIDPYALDYPVCQLSLNKTSGMPRAWAWGKVFKQNLMRREVVMSASSTRREDGWLSLLRDSTQREKELRVQGLGYEACSDAYTSQYLNSPEVKNSIHALPNITWADCSATLRYDFRDELLYMQPYYSYLMDEGTVPSQRLRILIFSGDDDAMCGTPGTRYWIDRMSWTLSYGPQDWMVEGQVAGSIQKYQGVLTFLVIKGAGHMVPATNPVAAYEMYKSFLEDKF